MSEQEILSGRVEKADIFLPFTPSLEQGYNTQPIFRLVVDVKESSSLGFLEQGYYIKVNESVYFIRKKEISVFTNTQTERVMSFLKKTGREFTVDVLNDKTISGHQFIELNDVDIGKGIYTLRDFAVYRSLWQTIEGELFENLYSPSVARFTDNRLIWYAKLLPQHSLTFSEVGKIKLEYVASQGHLEIYRIEKQGDFVLPVYLFSVREGLRLFNHEVKAKVDVIPLGSERRIISIDKETQVLSNEHETITLPEGQYLLFHPRPQQHRID